MTYNWKPKYKSLIAIMLLMSLTLGLTGQANAATGSGPRQTTNNLLDAVMSGELKDAYNFTSPEYKQNNNFPNFKKLIKGFKSLNNLEHWSVVGKKKISDSNVMVEVVLNKDILYTDESPAGAMRLDLLKTDEGWKINQLNIIEIYNLEFGMGENSDGYAVSLNTNDFKFNQAENSNEPNFQTPQVMNKDKQPMEMNGKITTLYSMDKPFNLDITYIYSVPAGEKEFSILVQGYPELPLNFVNEI